MTIKQRLEDDIKSAMLAGDKVLVTTLRGLKSAILYVEVAAGSREEGLTDDAAVSVLAKEAKKRRESASLYTQGGSQEKAQAELNEAAIIEAYLPKQMSDTELEALVDTVCKEIGTITSQNMGLAIGKVRAIGGSTVDGGRIAAAVKSRIVS